MFQKLLYLAFIAILLPCRLFAWGHEGHRIVAELAMLQLSDATQVNVEQIPNGITQAEA